MIITFIANIVYCTITCMLGAYLNAHATAKGSGCVCMITQVANLMIDSIYTTRTTMMLCGALLFILLSSECNNYHMKLS